MGQGERVTGAGALNVLLLQSHWAPVQLLCSSPAGTQTRGSIPRTDHGCALMLVELERYQPARLRLRSFQFGCQAELCKEK